MIPSLAVVVAILLSPLVNGVSAQALHQIQRQTTITSSHQPSDNSVSTESGDGNHHLPVYSTVNDISFQTNAGASVSSSSATANTNSGFDGILGNLGNDINRMVQSNVQKTISSASTTINKTLTGKITASQINLKSGNVERVLFGDWSLDAKGTTGTTFTAKFAVRTLDEASKQINSANTKSVVADIYSLGNVKVNSVQQQNSDLTLRGTADVSAVHGTNGASQSWNGIPISISISNQDSVIIIGFDKKSAPGNIFQNVPIVGVVLTSSSSYS
ncbi:MAG TPA: hypothetical protein VE843_17050, partial [Ktedonobacteraceae bacterium]|nr:hypothetical protein [Ktedonobacteraceae bacterium]